MSRTIHIIGAGLSGLAAALKLSQRGEKVVLHEATAQAGGRCRSYFDHAIGLTIDNGNHLLLSGNHAAMEFLAMIGSHDRLLGPQSADFPFYDLQRGERWTLRINDGRLPYWVFDSKRRVPGTTARDYLPFVKLMRSDAQKTVGDVVACNGPVYERLVHPVLLAALNVDPAEGSLKLASAIIRETLALGGEACRPLVARQGLAHAMIDPAIKTLRSRGVDIQFGHELRALKKDARSIQALVFAEGDTALGMDDRVVLAVPAWIAATLLPEIKTPDHFRAIVNLHFKHVPPAGTALITGVVGGTVEWLFAFADRLSVTISNADHLLTQPREELSQQVWREVAQIAGIDAPLPASLPPWQIVRERRATFAATPEQDKKRPETKTPWNNLFLAGDWTATGLPATIEGSIRSGYRAAELI